MVKLHIHARNSLYNFAGFVIPMVIAVIAIPSIIKSLGVERFGILTIAWMVIGYFSFFNLGIGRATTKIVAEVIAKREPEGIDNIFWTSIFLLFIGGCAGCLILETLTSWLVISLLDIPGGLISEATTIFRLLGVTLPFVLASEGLRGTLEAQNRFDVVNAIKIPASAANYAIPLIVLLYKPDLVLIVSAIVVARIVFFFVYLIFCLTYIDGSRYPQKPKQESIKRLLSFGGWVTVSSIVSPLMTYLDRFFIGATLGIGAVAYYAAPYDMVMKLLVVSGSLLMSVFPTFSGFSADKSEEIIGTYKKSLYYVAVLMAPAIVVGVFFADSLIQLWLGDEFAAKSTRMTQILLIGVYINSLAGAPFSLLQAAGRPDINAKLHLAELPVYVVALLALAKYFGLEGVAVAWTGRVFLDAVLLFWISGRLVLKESKLDMNFLYTLCIVLVFSFMLILLSIFSFNRYLNLCLFFSGFGVVMVLILRNLQTTNTRHSVKRV